MKYSVYLTTTAQALGVPVTALAMDTKEIRLYGKKNEIVVGTVSRNRLNLKLTEVSADLRRWLGL